MGQCHRRLIALHTPSRQVDLNSEEHNEQPNIGNEFKRFALVLGALGAACVGGGWVALGLDFAAGALVGWLIVMSNVYWTRNIVRSILFGDSPTMLVSGGYIFKLGLSGVVLYIAITRFQVDIFGLVLGLSVILPGSVIFMMLNRPRQ